VETTEPSVFSVVTVFVPSVFETVVVFFPSLSVTTVVVTPLSVEVVVDEPSSLSVVVDTLPEASVVVVTSFPSLYVVTQVFTPAVVVHVGPLVTVTEGAAVVVVTAHTPAPLVTEQWFVPWHVTLPQVQVPISSEPFVDAHAEAGVGEPTVLPSLS
jgi:hypothetical protein